MAVYGKLKPRPKGPFDFEELLAALSGTLIRDPPR